MAGGIHGGACVVGGMCGRGHVWLGACMAGGMCGGGVWWGEACVECILIPDKTPPPKSTTKYGTTAFAILCAVPAIVRRRIATLNRLYILVVLNFATQENELKYLAVLFILIGRYVVADPKNGLG